MTLYVAQAAGNDAAALEKARFVKQGFSWPAFVFAQLWLLYNRLWIPLLIWIVLEIVFFIFVAPHVDVGVTFAIDLLARLFLGFEGGALRLKRGAPVTDVIDARDRDAAETIFFHRQLGETRA